MKNVKAEPSYFWTCPHCGEPQHALDLVPHAQVIDRIYTCDYCHEKVCLDGELRIGEPVQGMIQASVDGENWFDVNTARFYRIVDGNVAHYIKSSE